MAEDTGPATRGSTKRCCDQDTSQSSSKRVKVDIPNSSRDTPQSSKKSPKRRNAAGYPKSRQGKEKDGKNVGRGRRDGPKTREAADVASKAKADPRDMPVSEKRLHGSWRTLPDFNLYVGSSEPGQDLEGQARRLLFPSRSKVNEEEVEDTGIVEGAAGVMDIEDGLEGFGNDAPDKV